jgi:hypothetical protein
MTIYKIKNGQRVPLSPEEEAEWHRAAAHNESIIARKKAYEEWKNAGDSQEVKLEAVLGALNSMRAQGADLGQDAHAMLDRWNVHRQNAVEKPEEDYEH